MIDDFKPLSSYDEIRFYYREGMEIRSMKVDENGNFPLSDKDSIASVRRIDLVHCFPNGFAMDTESYYPAYNSFPEHIIANCELKPHSGDYYLSPLKVIHTYGGQYITGPLSYIQMVGFPKYKIRPNEWYGRGGTIWAMKK